MVMQAGPVHPEEDGLGGAVKFDVLGGTTSLVVLCGGGGRPELPMPGEGGGGKPIVRQTRPVQLGFRTVAIEVSLLTLPEPWLGPGYGTDKGGGSRVGSAVDVLEPPTLKQIGSVQP